MNTYDERSDGEEGVALPPPIPLPDVDDADWTQARSSEGTATIGPGLRPEFVPEYSPAAARPRQQSSAANYDPVIDGYRIRRRLGQGGMGTVYLAVDEQLDRLVAVKVLNEGANTTPRMRDRFLTESKTVAQLQHPNIAQLYAAGETNGRPFLVMEFIEGPTLAETLTDDEGENPRRAAELVRTLADAMQYCHQRHIVHRDLKPSNILIDIGGRPKVADFGVAKLLQSSSGSTVTGEIVGTPTYMSPEQASGLVKGLGPPSDVYSLGAILYKLLTGKAPFVAENPMQTLMSVLTDDVVPPRKIQKQIPKDLETICLKCLEKKVSRRYATAAELSEELTRFLNDEPIQARPGGVVDRATKWSKRHPAKAAMLVAIGLGIIGTIAGLAIHSQQLKSQLTKNQRLAERGSDLSIWLVNEHIGELRSIRGSTPVQLAVVERVQEYLDENLQDAEANPKLLRRLAVAYLSLGDIQGNPNYQNLGRLDQAQENYNQAIEVLERSLSLEASDRPSALLLVNAHIKSSDVALQNSTSDEVQKHLETAEKLLSPWEEEIDDEVLMLRISINQRWHDVALEQNRFADSLEYLSLCEQDLDAMSDDPKWDRDKLHQQVVIDESRGTTLEAQGDYQEAEKAYRAAMVAARTAFQETPRDPDAILRYASIIVSLADCLSFLEEFEQSLDLYELSLQYRRELATEDPQNQAYRVQLATALSRVGSAYELLGDFETAIERLDEAIVNRERSLEVAPSNRELTLSLAIDLLSHGRINMQRKEFAAAIESFDRQAELIKEEVGKEKSTPAVLNVAAQAEFHRGLISFEKMMVALEEVELFTRDFPLFKQTIQHLDRSLELFKRIAEQGAMTASQEAFRASVEETKKLILEMASQIEGAQI